jgi:hypothetical protein
MLGLRFVFANAKRHPDRRKYKTIFMMPFQSPKARAARKKTLGGVKGFV